MQYWDKLNRRQQDSVEAFALAVLCHDTESIEEEYTFNRWRETRSPNLNINVNYRIKPKPEYVPFTINDAERFLGRIVKPKNGNDKFMGVICGAQTNGVAVSTQGTRTYQDLLNDMVFSNGEPCGKLNK